MGSCPSCPTLPPLAQAEADEALGAALTWARANLAQADIESLARRAGLSIRTLHRRCLQQIGTTPAKLLHQLRIEHARTLLTTSALSHKALAEQCGFGSPARMHRAFQRALAYSLVATDRFGQVERDQEIVFANEIDVSFATRQPLAVGEGGLYFLRFENRFAELEVTATVAEE